MFGNSSEKSAVFCVISIELDDESSEKSIYEEGCLSVPNQFAEIGRPSKLEINVSKVNNITKKPWIFGESVIVSEGKFYL